MRWSALREEAGTWWQRLAGKRMWVQILLWAAVVAALGELKLQLFAASPFRITLGPVGLGMALLFFPNLPALVTGVAAGATVVLLRTAGGLAGGGALPGLLSMYWPAGVYYVCYSGLFLMLRAWQLPKDRPLLLVAAIAAVDALSNMLELGLRPDPVTLYAIEAFVLVGMFRAIMLTGLYVTMKSQETEWRFAQERAEYRRLLLFVTDLQAEIFFLRKSSAEIERVMVRAHTLHRDLKGEPGLSAMALAVATDVHEIKKDYERILAGLGRLVKVRSLEPCMAMSEVVSLVWDSNRDYAERMQKAIALTSTVRDDFQTAAYRVWVSVLNNLVINAVEACGERGEVAVHAGAEGDRYVVRVIDTGCGIPRDEWELIFRPGYSTKSDPLTGEFSTGLGLAHAAGLVKSMGGEIGVERSSPAGTVFRVSCPLRAGMESQACR